jgi:hypothetical protein
MVTEIILEPFGLLAQKTVQAWWGLDTSSADRVAGTLPEQPSPILYRLFQWVVDSVETRWSPNSQFAQAVSDQHIVQSLAFKALTNWPMGFYDFLREHLEWEVRMYSYLHCCDFSGPVYLRSGSSLAFWICRFQHLPEFSFVQEAVDRFMAANNIQVYSDYASTRILLNADEDLQKIARPIVQRMLDRLSKLVEPL